MPTILKSEVTLQLSPLASPNPINKLPKNCPLKLFLSTAGEFK
jgi:hypothetical protein